MEISALRKTVGIILGAGGVVIGLSYGVAGYLYYTRTHPKAAVAVRAPAHRFGDLLAAADGDLKQHRVEQALVNYREALSLNPQSVPAQSGLADGELLAGREAIASREYQRVLKLDAKNSYALLQLAHIYSHQPGTWPQAEARYRDYLDQKPDDAAARLGLARVLAWQRKAQETAALFGRPEVSRLMTPDDERDYAFALVRLGRGREAEPVLRKLLAGRPGDSELEVQLADIYAARKDWSAALPLYRRLLAGRPGDAHLNFSYGLGLLATRNYRAALAPLARARAAMPAGGEAQLAYARAVKGTGNRKQAVKEYERALPHYRNDAGVIREYADVLLEKRDYKKAANYYSLAYRRGLRDNRLLAGYAGALTGARKYKDALPYMEELHRREPTDRVTFDLAHLLWKLGRNDRARELLSQVHAAPPREARRR